MDPILVKKIDWETTNNLEDWDISLEVRVCACVCVCVYLLCVCALCAKGRGRLAELKSPRSCTVCFCTRPRLLQCCMPNVDFGVRSNMLA